MRRSLTCTGTLVVLSLALGACGGGGASTPHGGRRPCPVGASCDNVGTPFAKGPARIAGAQRGGTVTVLTHAGLAGTLDPSGASATDSVSLLSGLVTRSLTQYRYNPRTHTMELVPDLATDVGVHNDDYTKWEFTVRGGARFEDGTRVTAYDVARGIRRCTHARAFPTSPCLDAQIRRVRVRQHTLLVGLAAPYPDLPYLAATPAFGPIPKGKPTTYGAYARHPMASGPYRIQRYHRGHQLVLVRNSQWDPTTDPARTQYPDRYVVRSGLAEAHIEHLLLADRGSARTALSYDTLRPDPFRRRHESIRLVLGPTPCTTYLAPDNRRITDPAVRRALLWAYPYHAVIRAAGLAPGMTAIPATSLEPPGIPGRTPITVRGHDAFATSPRVARRMLAAADAVGTPLRFYYSPGDAASVRTKNALVRSLRAAGFDPVPLRQPAELFNQAPATLPIDLRTSTRCGQWPVGSQWLRPVYGTTHPDRSGQLLDNTEAFTSRYVEHEIRRIARLPEADAPAAWNKLDHAGWSRWSPVVPLWYGGVAMAHGSQVQGMVDDSVTGMPAWPRIWVGNAP